MILRPIGKLLVLQEVVLAGGLLQHGIEAPGGRIDPVQVVVRKGKDGLPLRFSVHTEAAVVDEPEDGRERKPAGRRGIPASGEDIIRHTQVPVQGNVPVPVHGGGLESEFELVVRAADPAENAEDGPQEREPHEEAGEEEGDPCRNRVLLFVRPEIGPFHRLVQHFLERTVLHAWGAEMALVEAQEEDHGVLRVQRTFRFEDDGAVLLEGGAAGKAEAPDPCVRRIQLDLVPVDADLHMLRRRGKPGREHLEVHHVIVLERLDGPGHHVDGVVHMVAVLPYSPAQFHAVRLVDDAVFARLFGPGAVHVPLSDILQLVVVPVIDGETLDFDVSEVSPDQVPFRDSVAGIDVPALVDDNVPVLDEGDVDVHVPHLLFPGRQGRRGEDHHGQEEEKPDESGAESHHFRV